MRTRFVVTRRELVSVLGVSRLGAQLTKNRMSIATAATGSVFSPLRGAMAAVFSKKVKGLEVTAELTGGVADNMQLLHARRVAMALIHGMVAFDATKGRIRGIPLRLRMLALLAFHTAQMHIVTLKSSRIQRVTDLKEKHVSTGFPGFNELCSRFLEAGGLWIHDFRARKRLGVGEAASVLIDHKIAALFWYGGTPILAILELAATPGIKIELFPSGALQQSIVARHGPIYSAGVIPRGIYKCVDVEVLVRTGRVLLVTHERMEEPLSYEVKKILVENLDELGKANRHARALTAQSVAQGAAVRYHPGAARVFGERKLT